MQRFLTVKQAAEAANLTERAVRLRIWRRQFPFIKLGRRTLISAVQLEIYLSSLPCCSADEALERIAAAAKSTEQAVRIGNGAEAVEHAGHNE